MSSLLYISFGDKVPEYPLPAVNDRKCGIFLPDMGGCTTELEVVNGGS